MALGLFDETVVPAGWFDATAQAAGWFDADGLDAGVTAVSVDVAAESDSAQSLAHIKTRSVALASETDGAFARSFINEIASETDLALAPTVRNASVVVTPIVVSGGGGSGRLYFSRPKRAKRISPRHAFEANVAMAPVIMQIPNVIKTNNAIILRWAQGQ